MKVKELKEIIKNLPDDMEIMLQKDSESTWSRDVYDDEWTADDAYIEDKDLEELKKAKRVLLFYPVN